MPLTLLYTQTNFKGRGELVRLLGVSSGREGTIILIPVQIILMALVATVLVHTSWQMHRRNRRSWSEIEARMSPECRIAWGGGTSEIPERVMSVWVESPWTMFRDAGAMIEMADYAERNAMEFDRGHLQTVRITAVQLRFAAAGAMLKHARFG